MCFVCEVCMGSFEGQDDVGAFVRRCNLNRCFKVPSVAGPLLTADDRQAAPCECSMESGLLECV